MMQPDRTVQTDASQMQRFALLIGALMLAAAVALSWLGASAIASYLENGTERAVRQVLDERGHDWVSLQVDGLKVRLAGEAPSEAARFNALSAAGSVVAARRIEDAMTVRPADGLKPPRFSIELLRNDSGISLIGLVPEASSHDSIIAALRRLDPAAEIADMLDTTTHPVPPGWQEALDFALKALGDLPRSKITVRPGEVRIAAITDSPEQRTRTEQALQQARPEGVKLVLDISAPRPVIAPFSLRLLMDEKGVRFDSCSADTEQARARILAAARAAGLSGPADCAIGLGAPSPRWAEAVERAIQALAALGGGSLTFSDADITLIARPGTPQDLFDREVRAMEKDLPDVFSVQAVLPPLPVVEGKAVAAEAAELMVTLSPEGLVQMRGRMRDERSRMAAVTLARALFGSDNVHDTTRVDPNLPEGWVKPVLAGLQALAELHHGLLEVTPGKLDLRGETARPDTRTRITQMLSESLKGNVAYAIDVVYRKELDHTPVPPTPEECVNRINAILKEHRITFKPSSSRIDAESMATVEKIAEAMKGCEHVRMEIGGHTDSQGRESMNLALSQARAEAVLDALLQLDVLTTNLTAKGYGESRPIADNKTEEGRRANRRIEFRLIGNEPDKAPGSAPETPSGNGGKDKAGQNAKAGNGAAEPHDDSAPGTAAPGAEFQGSDADLDLESNHAASDAVKKKPTHTEVPDGQE